MKKFSLTVSWVGGVLRFTLLLQYKISITTFYSVFQTCQGILMLALKAARMQLKDRSVPGTKNTVYAY